MKASEKAAFALGALVLVGILVAVVGAVTGTSSRKPVGHVAYRETVYVSNYASQFISDRTIRDDIPAWEHAVNTDFAGYWHTTRYRIVFIGRRRAPSGSISAVFLPKGPVKGALAYHWTERGNAPSITVYAGTGDYYGFDNSVSFTHELFELAADPVTSFVNQGYPVAGYYLENRQLGVRLVSLFSPPVGWLNEVSDPVEADSYTLPGVNGPVKISDFVTPSWFADGVGGRYDFLGLCQQPFWIRPGGYAQYVDATGWNLVQNFRAGYPADRGFVKSDPKGNR